MLKLSCSNTFPSTPIRDGESLIFDGVKFTVIDLGPGESPHDSPWVLGDDETVVFAWITFESRAERDRINAEVMKDPRMTEMPVEAKAIDMKRMVYGGFEVLVDL